MNYRQNSWSIESQRVFASGVDFSITTQLHPLMRESMDLTSLV
jgi:hypothetical protein